MLSEVIIVDLLTYFKVDHAVIAVALGDLEPDGGIVNGACGFTEIDIAVSIDAAPYGRRFPIKSKQEPAP